MSWPSGKQWSGGALTPRGRNTDRHPIEEPSDPFRLPRTNGTAGVAVVIAAAGALSFSTLYP
jgi:hypothetical protein